MSSHVGRPQGPRTPRLTAGRSNLHLMALPLKPAPTRHELLNRRSLQRPRSPTVAGGHPIVPNTRCAPRGMTPLIGPTSFARKESRWQVAAAELLDRRSSLRGSPLLNEHSLIAHRLHRVCQAID